MLFRPLADAQDLIAIPPLKAHVTDLASTLSQPQRESIEQKLSIYESQKGTQIALLIIPTTKPEEIEQFAIRLAETWKIGRAKIDDGVILVVAKEDRTLRIEVGYGFEGVLTDYTAKQIIDGIIVPNFRAGNFYQGIDSGLDSIIKVLSGEELPKPIARNENFEGQFPPILMILFFIGISLIRGFTQVSGISKSSARFGSALIGSVIFAIVTYFFIGLIAALIAFFIFLIFASSSAGSSRGYGSSRSWGSGSSGGGFSGGGGSFGGGGASGRW
ncbi:MAG: TPM domain-containing protein [bacterium]|nr:TPM domain-containing protein [bacterium]